MNHKTENKIGKIAHKGLTSAVASSMKRGGLNSQASKQAASVLVKNMTGVKSGAPNSHQPSSASLKPKVSVQVNSGNIAAGFGVRGKAVLSTHPLEMRQKASIRTMTSPNASIELNMPVINKEHFSVQVGGTVKFEKDRKPEYGVKGELNAKF